MPIHRVQNFIYEKSVRRPKVNGILDRFGAAMNRIGIPYATGLTRNKAILFASKDEIEVQQAKTRLFASGRKRAVWAIWEKESGPRTLGQRLYYYIHRVQPAFEKCGMIYFHPEELEAGLVEKHHISKLTVEKLKARELSIEEMDQLLEITKGGSLYTSIALSAWSKLADAGTDRKTILSLFGSVEESLGLALLDSGLLILPQLAENGLSEERIYQLFSAVKDRITSLIKEHYAAKDRSETERINVTEGFIRAALQTLPALTAAKYSEREMVSIIMSVMETIGPCPLAIFAAFAALPELTKTGFNTEEIRILVTMIAAIRHAREAYDPEKYFTESADLTTYAFEELPETVRKLREHGLTKEDIKALFLWAFAGSSKWLYRSLQALPESVIQLLNDGQTLPQILSLIKTASMAVGPARTDKAIASLPALVESGLRESEIWGYFVQTRTRPGN